MSEKIVKIDVVSHTGHDTLELSPALALEQVREQVNTGNKWCLVDGKVKNVDTLTSMDMAQAENIVLTDKMVGGNTN